MRYMKLVYRGKTKDVYEDGQDTLRLIFTDRVTKTTPARSIPAGTRWRKKPPPARAKPACS